MGSGQSRAISRELEESKGQYAYTIASAVLINIPGQDGCIWKETALKGLSHDLTAISRSEPFDYGGQERTCHVPIKELGPVPKAAKRPDRIRTLNE
jgi:hypothetical protein